MKREFLQNLKVGEQALPKEVIDAILDENGRDIARAKSDAVKPYEDYDALKATLSNLELKHKQELSQLRFRTALETSIGKAKGRNATAIAALLDVQALQQSEDVEKAIDQALAQLKREHNYLFLQDVPPYAPGTGSGAPIQEPATLAGALRERFERK